jgi:hypothetical protein
MILKGVSVMHYVRKKTIFPMLLLLFCIFYTQTARGAGISLKTAQQTYKPGDTILITADLHNNYNQAIDIVLECLLTSQTKKSPEIIIPKFVTLEPDESSTVTLFEIFVTQDFPSDEYRAVINPILNGIPEGEREITFQIQDTLKKMEFSVHLCEDTDCNHEPTVFIKEKNIYMSYESPIGGIQVEGDIYFPDMSVKPVVLPTVFQTAETGSYVLNVTASKEAYKSETREVNFAIIEQEANIEEVEIDIKPGSEPNCIKVTKKGVTPVAILANATFDVKDIDLSTILIDDDDVPGGGVSAKKSSTNKDVNGDGLSDLVLHFSTPDLNSAGLLADEHTLYITGTLDDGLIISGSDVIYVAGGPNCFD